MTRLVVGTRNAKKGREMHELLAPFAIHTLTLAEFPTAGEVDETGTTFAENAALKASEYARQTGEWVIADDSGLAVDALGGRPGVYSARYAGPQATDEDNNRLLLAELAHVPLEKRTAHYVAHIALADPTGEIRARAEDYCRGRILTAEQGTGGFGYDPLFEIVEYHQTFGRLAPVVKACLSHRARALRAILPQVIKLLQPS